MDTISNLVLKAVLSDKVELAHLQSLLELFKQKAEGANVRPRRRWIEKGDQNSCLI